MDAHVVARLPSAGVTLLRVGLGAVFLIAGGLKLFDPGGSVGSVAAYRIFPTWAEEVIGRGLPIVEVAVGGLLLIGVWTRVAAAAAGALLLAFIAGMVSAWARDLPISCGCFGTAAEGEGVGVIDVLRDVAFLGAAAIVLWKPDLGWGVDRWTRH
jgi:uncharacterized membrane protein YphA (DoxX/SURF4 family)